MAERIKLPPFAKRGHKMVAGKGWRLVTASKNRSFKAALIVAYHSMGGRFAIFRIE
jgi:hypothetical protein